MIGLVLWSSAVWLVLTLVFAAGSDRYGRRRVYLWGAWSGLAMAFPLFWLLDTREPWLMALGMTLLAVSMSAMYSPIAAMLSELFPTRLRYTGNSVSYQVGTLVGGAFVPIIATTLMQLTGTSASISAYMFGSILIGMLAVKFVPETSKTSLGAAD